MLGGCGLFGTLLGLDRFPALFDRGLIQLGRVAVRGLISAVMLPMTGGGNQGGIILEDRQGRFAESDLGIGEAGAAGPANPYGDPAGHSWLAIAGARTATRNVLTGLDDREDNMVAFTAAALQLFAEVLADEST